ncbi:MAG: YafY family transcriptional regulator [Planctomycetes bacterium]|nr:YafY family transcriptional regulator [Planctomycetota bacterium]
MRRADRLFRIVEYLKARRQVVTADTLASVLEVSVRTIYRDIADLGSSGVPIIGEAGVGYLLNRDYLVQPLMFDVEELDALALGARMVESWGDRAIAKAARQAVDKITAVLPETLQNEIQTEVIFSLPSRGKHTLAIDFTSLRRAIRTRHRVEFRYTTEEGVESQRRVRPLCLAFFAPVWLLTGWCETREDFRNFRLDRMQTMQIKDDPFRDEKGKRLRDYQEQMQRQCKV